MPEQKKWETYEEVAAYLIGQFAVSFGLAKVEGKQKVAGLHSGTEWEIDAKGIAEGADKIVIVECRRYTTSRISQEAVGGLAYRISDTEADGGILVSPLGLQEGAEKVAQAENVIPVTLTPDSTTTEYVMRFLNQICLGFSDTIQIKDSFTITVTDKDGNVGHRQES